MVRGRDDRKAVVRLDDAAGEGVAILGTKVVELYVERQVIVEGAAALDKDVGEQPFWEERSEVLEAPEGVVVAEAEEAVFEGLECEQHNSEDQGPAARGDKDGNRSVDARGWRRAARRRDCRNEFVPRDACVLLGQKVDEDRHKP